MPVREISAPTPGELPPRVCRRCGIPQPPSAFYAEKGRPDGRARVCVSCVKARIAAATARNKAARQAQGAAPAGGAVPPGLGALPGRSPAGSLRATFEQATDREWPKLCKKAVDLAVRGDRQMLRLVLAYRLGRPPETAEDNGVHDFFSLVLGALRGDGAAGGPDAPAD